MKSVRRNVLSSAITLVVVSLVSTTALAGELPLRKLSPVMPLKICHTQDSLKNQAKLSKSLSLSKANADEYEAALVKDKCELVIGSIFLEETEDSILPFATWAPEIRADGEYDFSIQYNGQSKVVTLGLSLQTVRYYRAKYKDMHGKWFQVWVELPESPAVIRYIAEQNKFK